MPCWTVSATAMGEGDDVAEVPGSRVWEALRLLLSETVLEGLLEGAGLGAAMISVFTLVGVDVCVLDLLGKSTRGVGDADADLVEVGDSLADRVDVDDEVELAVSVAVEVPVLELVGEADAVGDDDGVTVALGVSEEELVPLCVPVGLKEADLELVPVRDSDCVLVGVPVTDGVALGVA